LLFEPYRSVRVGTLRVAIIGLTAEDTDRQPEDYLIIPANEALSGLLPDIADDHDLIVLLSSGSTTQATQIAERFPEIDLIIGADPKRNSVPAFLANNAIVVQSGNRGMSLGFLKASWTGQSWGVDPEQERARLMERLASLSWQISRLKNQKHRDPAASGKKMEMLLSAQQQAETELARMTATLSASVSGNAPSTFQALLLPLRGSFAEDPKIRALIDQGKQRAVEQNENN
jgi:2',3'-cyclic-nucleotide 2'-phosphodiesterase (5'-nucleotidase family)